MLEEVADGVWVRQSEWVWSNATVVRAADGLVVVDPGIAGADLEELADGVEVDAAMKLSPINGSSQSASAGTAMRPSSEYGYTDADSSTITTCSPDHNVAKPARSAAPATASIT